ncbi:MAG TPA: DUF3667 domain-containing protein [Casimicrobiaceae bacterium]|nr:DUF3667 domain-containing protein [Casimicrobiaceae bacterium]
MAAVAPERARAASASAHADRDPACRNCGAPAGDAFCPRCGQETTTQLPSARQFLKDAAGRYVALDGRLWRTLAALLFHPGFLTREYLAGRRRRYVRPARLFLVLSLAMFAAIRLSLGVPELANAIVIDPPSETQPVPAGTDSSGRRPSSVVLALPGVAVNVDDQGNVSVEGGGAMAQALRERIARFEALPRDARTEQMVLGTLRYGPYAMFALLPAFALLLLVAYAGRGDAYPRRPRRYAEHLVFAAHNHAFFFLAVALAVAIPWPPLRTALTIWSVVYGLWSMRAVYGGRWAGVLARAWVIAVAYVVLFCVATAGLLLAAIMIR